MIIKQMIGEYKAKSPNIIPLYQEAIKLRDEFDSIAFRIPDSEAVMNRVFSIDLSDSNRLNEKFCSEIASARTFCLASELAYLNKKGLACTLDILGEHTKDSNEATAITNKYNDILN